MDGKHHLLEEDGLLFKLFFYFDCYGILTSIELGHTPQLSHHLPTIYNSHQITSTYFINETNIDHLY